MYEITIIIPVYNEIKTIEKLLLKVLGLRIKKQIILIDDCSTDGTKKIINAYKKKINKIIYHNKNTGKGSAIRSAQRFIKGNYTVIQDADLEYQPDDILKLLKKIKKKKIDVIYGSRVLNKKKYQNTKNFTHFIRIIGNVFLTKVSNFVNNQRLTDAHTCYKMFKSKIFKKIKIKENGFAFCPEITTKLSNKNINIVEMPISYKGRTYAEGKKINSYHGIEALYCLLKYKLF
tara:strand:+ start:316 stop:1011 length:696 start_codon:yes stop_codon:yes gene_type:complete